MKSPIIIALVAGVLVFIVSFYTGYKKIASHQPGGLSPITSYPPSSAWIPALLYTIVVIVIVFIICWVVFRK